MNNDYKAAGVDVEAGYRAVELMKAHVAGTMRKEVVGGLGGFGGMFSLAAAKDMEEPVLVSGTDGVGTKLKLAFLMDKHDTIGIDCVAMCVNDIICVGAEPLYFLDYIACGKNVPEKIEQIVKGVAAGCKMSGASLIGGETAEMPGFYPVEEYDLAGFAVGLLDRKNIIDGSSITEGDAIIGIGSSGVHSNGYSLVRRVFSPSLGNIDTYIESLGCTLGEELLRPTKIYVEPVGKVIKEYPVKGIANITGGGFIENIPRILPEGLGAAVKRGSWNILPVFDLLRSTGDIDEKSMYNTFNMGIGMVMAVAPEMADNVVSRLHSLGETAYMIGEVVQGSGVRLC